ncbi:MAG: hypothetical protein EOO75_13120, partial [Myxococcales bacterium]
MTDPGRIFRVRGRVVDEAGAPVEGLWVALVDADPVLDDFLGAGLTHPDGSYELSFARDEFNRERFELEQTPDLYAVVSVTRDGVDVPVARHVFAPVRPGPATHALEDIRVAMHGGQPPALAGQEAFPGLYHPSARRLRIDRELVEAALAEVVPRVEELTGWSNLLDGITVLLEHEYDDAAVHRRLCDRLGVPHNDQPRHISDACLAFYQPTTRTVVVRSEVSGRQGYEALKQILGHELVHVGQYTRYPDLLERHENLIRRALRMEHARATSTYDGEMHALAASEWRRGMTYLEATVEDRRQREQLEADRFAHEANIESYA